ncbi:MAG: hypothetical protein ACOX61_06620 [Brooklawnia sp.]|jgi:hypothetical protein
MMGLKTRLALSRTLVWVGLQRTPEILAGLVGQLVAGRADVVVLVQPDAQPDDLVSGYRAAVAAGDGRSIIGLAGPAQVASTAQADLVVADASAAQAPAHRYGLSLAVAGDATELESALAAGQVDAVVLPAGLTGVALRLAPPHLPSSKPWFVQTDTLAAGRELVAAGVRRLALEAPPVTAEADLGMPPRAVVAAYREALADSWRADMQQVSLAGFAATARTAAAPTPPAHGLVDGLPRPRQTPDAPLPDVPVSDDEGDGWGQPWREKGPDDHW